MMHDDDFPARRSSREEVRNEQERLHRYYRWRKIGATAAGLLFMGAGCFTGALPAFCAWSVGYVLAADALRMHRGKLGLGREGISRSQSKEIRDAVHGILIEVGLPEAEVYVHSGHGEVRGVHTWGARSRILIPLELANLPHQQFQALVYREAVRMHHRDSFVLGTVRAMKGSVNAARRYLMWMPIWVAGGGEWGFNVFGMVHAALGVAASPLYLGVLAGGIGMRCCQAVLGRYQELRADRDAAELLHTSLGRREVLSHAISEVAEREMRAFGVRCAEFGNHLSHRPILGHLWNGCALRVVEIHRSIVEGRTRLIRAISWGVRDHPPTRTRVERLDPDSKRSTVSTTDRVLPGASQPMDRSTRSVGQQQYRRQANSSVQVPHARVQYHRPIQTSSRDVGLE